MTGTLIRINPRHFKGDDNTISFPACALDTLGKIDDLLNEFN